MAIKFCNTFGLYMLGAASNVAHIERLVCAPFEGENKNATLYLERYQAVSPELLQMFGAAGWPSNQVSEQPIELDPGDILYFTQYFAAADDRESKTMWFEATVSRQVG